MDSDVLVFADYVAAPVFVLEPDGAARVVYRRVNRAWSSVTKLQTSDVAGKTAVELFGGRLGDAAHRHHCAAVLDGAERTYDIMLPLDGHVHSVRTTLIPVLDGQGRVTQLVGSSRDMTADRESQEFMATVETASSEVETFISLAAHDLQTPLENIERIAEVLREDIDSLGIGDITLIDSLEGIATKATTVISDILGHAQATRSVSQKMTFDAAETCAEIFVLLDPMREHHLQVQPLTIDADRAVVQIILRNLIDNAIRHGGPGRRTIEITVEPVDTESLAFTVLDDGAGFEDPKAVFGPGAAMGNTSGVSLLSIQRLISARGGTILAANRPDGRGAMVRFTLPGTRVDTAA